jgi:hypothetical protein
MGVLISADVGVMCVSGTNMVACALDARLISFRMVQQSISLPFI